MDAISKLKLEICISPSSNERYDTLSELFDIFPRISPRELNDQQILDDEWRNLPMILSQMQHPPNNDKTDEFWHEINKLKSQSGEKKFQHLPTFMLGILSLPHSNAACERIFSQVNDIKTKKRNKLITKTIKGNILAQQSLQRNGKSCIDFEPSRDMISKMSASIYEKEVISLD